MTQFSLFGADAASPDLSDLDGMVLAGGQWVRAGSTARLSVLVDDRWRAEALVAAFAERGTTAELVAAARPPTRGTAGAGGFAVRSEFDDSLAVQARRWTRGAGLCVPADFELGAAGLRIWALAAGYRDAGGYLLLTARTDVGVRAERGARTLHDVAGAHLSRLGVAAAGLGAGTTRASGSSARAARPGRERPAWRVTSTRRLRRLVELLGPPPPGGEDDWPDARPPLTSC